MKRSVLFVLAGCLATAFGVAPQWKVQSELRLNEPATLDEPCGDGIGPSIDTACWEMTPPELHQVCISPGCTVTGPGFYLNSWAQGFPEHTDAFETTIIGPDGGVFDEITLTNDADHGWQTIGYGVWWGVAESGHYIALFEATSWCDGAPEEGGESWYWLEWDYVYAPAPPGPMNVPETWYQGKVAVAPERASLPNVPGLP